VLAVGALGFRAVASEVPHLFARVILVLIVDTAVFIVLKSLSLAFVGDVFGGVYVAFGGDGFLGQDAFHFPFVD
jgi:hypothetical protein